MHSRTTLTIFGIFFLLAIASIVFSDCKIVDQLNGSNDSNSKNCCDPEDERSHVLYEKADYLNKLNKQSSKPTGDLQRDERRLNNEVRLISKETEIQKPYPYVITDDCKTIARPCELVVEVPENESPLEKKIREKYLKSQKLTRKDICDCHLELWVLEDCDPQGSGINDILTAANSDDGSGVQSIGMGRNALVFGFTEPLPTIFTRPDNIVEELGNSAVDAAVLDTGLDPNHSLYGSHVYWPEKFKDCNGDAIVRDYVNGKTFIYDDNGHGTHVAGIIAQNLLKKNIKNFRLIPYKTHDENGMSTVFKLACATYRAIEDQVDVINLSCGYYGDNPIYNKALKMAFENDIIVVNSVGNDENDVASIGFNPAIKARNNPMLISVGAHRRVKLVYQGRTDYLSSYSNTGSDFVEITAQGDNINSSWPGGGYYCLTGTSMAAPAVTAKVVELLSQNVNTLSQIEGMILSDSHSQQDPHLLNFVMDGRKLTNYGYANMNCELVTPQGDSGIK